MLAKTRKVAADLRPRAFEQNRCFGGPTGGSRAPTATAGALRCSTYMDEGGRDRTTGGRAGTGSGRAVPGPARAPPQSGAYAFEAISAPMIVSTRRGGPHAVPTPSDCACTSSAAAQRAGRRGHPGAKRAGRAIECGSSATPWSGHDRPTPRPRMVPGASSTGTDHQHRPARHGGTVTHLHSLASARNRLVAEATPKPPGPSGRRDLPARQPGRFVPVFFVQAALHPRHGGRQRGGGDGRAEDALEEPWK